MTKYVQIETMALPPSLNRAMRQKLVYRMTCPRCQSTVRLRPGRFHRCECGHRWRLRISAVAMLAEYEPPDPSP